MIQVFTKLDSHCVPTINAYVSLRLYVDVTVAFTTNRFDADTRGSSHN